MTNSPLSWRSLYSYTISDQTKRIENINNAIYYAGKALDQARTDNDRVRIDVIQDALNALNTAMRNIPEADTDL